MVETMVVIIHFHNNNLLLFFFYCLVERIKDYIILLVEQPLALKVVPLSGRNLGLQVGLRRLRKRVPAEGQQIRTWRQIRRH
jgi:hypothetical protein